MHQIDDQKEIAYNREVNQCRCGADRLCDQDDLDMNTLALDDPNSDRNEKYRYIFI